MCIFGDRLYTDIAVGKRHGVTAILVLSGETQPEDVDAAEEKDKPDFVFPSLDDVDHLMFG
jgi:ribonucleotide monophosphatase NagD (HAD superfamily)